MRNGFIVLDPALTELQVEIINNLSVKDIEEIDSILMSQISFQWQKSAKIIGTTILAMQGEHKLVPDVFCTTRLKHLVKIKKIEARGDLSRMRYSEVRLFEDESSKTNTD